MPSIRNTPEFQTKLNDIKTKLMGNPSRAELEAMQLHISALDKLARISAIDNDDRDHDVNDHDQIHHDVREIAMDVAQKAARSKIV